MIGLKSLVTAGLLTAALGFVGTATASAHEGYDAQGNYVGNYTPGYAPAPVYTPAPQYVPAPAPAVCAPPPVVYCPPRPVVIYSAPVYSYPRPYCGPVYPRYYSPYGHHRDRFHFDIHW